MQIAVFLILLLFQQACYALPEGELVRSKRYDCCEGDSDSRCCCKVNNKECKLYGFDWMQMGHRYALECLEMKFLEFMDYDIECGGCNKFGWKC